VEEFFGLLVASTKLDPLLIHVPYVLRGEIGVCIINCLEEHIKTCNIGGIKVLGPLWIKTSRPGIENFRPALLKPIDPMFAWSPARQLIYEVLNVLYIQGLCN
jgi:hypothetical protein